MADDPVALPTVGTLQRFGKAGQAIGGGFKLCWTAARRNAGSSASAVDQRWGLLVRHFVAVVIQSVGVTPGDV
ncbi:hypothetical protein [Lentzea albidocapillata]|uniref:hypothetical protein n=1 Tax=Lentzea albidocapillata TaxID=40571 RepID=UPI001183FB6A|nr:hypothetical protein [Lentzea albidocapillata]